MTRRIGWPIAPGSAAEAGMVIDFSKTHLGPDTLTAFEALAEAGGLCRRRARRCSMAGSSTPPKAAPPPTARCAAAARRRRWTKPRRC